MRNLCAYSSDEFRSIYKAFSSSVKSLRTLDEYTGYINLLCNFLGKDFLKIDEDDAEKYFVSLNSSYKQGKLSRHTIGVRLSCYRSVSSYIESLGSIENYESPFRFIRRPEMVYNEVSANKVPSLEELDTITGVIRDDPMFYLVFSLASRVGLSATDIVAIRYSMIGKENGKYYIVYPQKTTFEQPRIVTLPEDVSVLMKNYLSITVPDSQGHVFFNKKQYPLTIRNIDAYFNKAYAESGLTKKYTLKDFRSRAILELADAGLDAKKISEYTGLKMDRAKGYVHSSYIINEDCPADLINYRLVVDDLSDSADEIAEEPLIVT